MDYDLCKHCGKSSLNLNCCSKFIDDLNLAREKLSIETDYYFTIRYELDQLFLNCATVDETDEMGQKILAAIRSIKP